MDTFVGIMGFSQARLAHLTCHEQQPETFFPGLKFVVMVAAGYGACQLIDLGILPTSDPATLLKLKLAS
jgi:hypothetical protein